MFRLPLLLLAAGALFAQAPSSDAPVKAGDLAPEIIFQKILNSGDSVPWNRSSLFGKTTVLVFFRANISRNLQSVSRWNALIDQYAGKPVQFVWITGENESSLLPSLKAHPIHGWVFYDPEQSTAKAYGVDLMDAAIVGTDGRIIGFDPMMVPSPPTVTAALEGRITTTPVKSGTPQFRAFVKKQMVLLDAQPSRMPAIKDHQPDFTPSYTVHISPANSENGGNFNSDNYWSLQNFGLVEVIGQIFNVNPIRIHLPAGLDDGKRYDFAIALPQAESKETMREIMQRGIEDHFGISISHEEQAMQVYVVTAVAGKSPAAQQDQGISGSSISVQRIAKRGDVATPQAPSIGDIRSVMTNGSLDDFCHTLESTLDRPVVNETNLNGEFKIDVSAGNGPANDLLKRLHDEANLDVTTAERTVPILVVTKR